MGPEVQARVRALQPGEVVMLENLRFHAEEEANDAAFAVHILDLDRFKEVNDTLGHATGDALLKHVARVLVSCTGEDDFVELDDAGNPRRKSAGRRRPAASAPARGKKGPARAEASGDADAAADVAGDDAAE